MTVCVKQIEVEEDLLTDFDNAANQNHKPGDQLLTDFMRDYVANTELVKQERKEAIEYATASVELEGFEFGPDNKNRAQQLIEGSIDSSDLTAHHEPGER